MDYRAAKQFDLEYLQAYGEMARTILDFNALVVRSQEDAHLGSMARPVSIVVRDEWTSFIGILGSLCEVHGKMLHMMNNDDFTARFYACNSDAARMELLDESRQELEPESDSVSSE